MKNAHTAKVIDITLIRAACSRCNVRQLCLPVGISNRDMQHLDQIIERQRPLSRGKHVFRQGDTFYALYAIRSGFVKTYTLTEDGTEQVTGFHLPGELLGMDAINARQHICSAKALETTSLCEIPFHRLEELMAPAPDLGQRLVHIISRSLEADHELLTLLCKKSAEERLATFLLSLSTRFKQRGYSSHEFHLSMSRRDIGNYLGLSMETASRIFSRFHQRGLIDVRRQEIRLEDIEQLKNIAGLSKPNGMPQDQTCPPRSNGG